MTTITDRLTRYLLARLRRQAIHDLYECAAEAGLLESTNRDNQSGLIWSLSSTTPITLLGDDIADREQIARLLRAPRSTRSPADGEISFDDDQPRSMPKRRREQEEWARVSQTSRSTRKPPREPVSTEHALRAAATDRMCDPGRHRVLRTLRSMVPPLNVGDVAAALLLARAVGESVGSLEQLFQTLRQPDAMVVVRVPIDGFEQRFGTMLEAGLILGSTMPQADGFGHYALSGSYRDVPAKLPRMITFGGLSLRQKSEPVVRTALARARSFADAPIVVADEGAGKLPVRITAAADLVITLEHVDRTLIAELLQLSAGIAPKAAFAAMARVGLDPRGLGLDDLMLAIRPGRSVDRIVDILKAIGKGGARDTEDEEEEVKETKPGKDKTGKNTAKSEVRFDVMPPEVNAGSPKPEQGVIVQRAPVLVETLNGYGAAATWALDLKADLALWRQGQLDWSELSTRLLLSGPPGTGKTTFAKALRNTLGVPLIATSVAHWLEPGYLGDVLKAMTAAFETAKSHSPCILFVDELDNIGSRGRSSQHSDYWDSLINRMLELLDGSNRHDGVVVVGATNHPDRIDSALLRSGRLEKHVVISPPDTDALVGILVHHLGGDLDHVLASRPSLEAAALEAIDSIHAEPDADPADGTRSIGEALTKGERACQ
ncbi:ATP-binding protein [Rhizobium sp. KVB221]|uniref:ATP-binding protein n=1 Tax=Rhizobium setariae TaxID=2801340 RepID=A0A936YLF2_9HYPH|nr:ATP-binding protein [Rhizobium setariae]MBL0370892.1 ATP-binding protein [Rhizobium setariae]